MSAEFAIPGLMPIGSPVYSGLTGTETMRILRGVTFLELWEIEPGDYDGYAVRAQARRNPNDPEPAFDLSPTLNAAGELRFEFTLEESLELPLGMFYTDVLLDHPDGVTVEVLVENQIVTVEDSATRPENDA